MNEPWMEPFNDVVEAKVLSGMIGNFFNLKKGQNDVIQTFSMTTTFVSVANFFWWIYEWSTNLSEHVTGVNSLEKVF